MNFPQEAIKEFQEIYKKEFGEEITKEQAEEMGSDLLEFYLMILE